MAWSVLLLLMCSMVAAVPPAAEVFKPGALVAPVGKILVVEDVMTVRYELGGLLSIPDNLQTVADRIRLAKNYLQRIKGNPTLSQSLKKTIYLQENRMNDLIEQLHEFKSTKPSHPYEVLRIAHANRQKRGLFNVFGVMSKYLFGTALAGDVEALGTHVNNVARAVTQQNRVVTQTYKALDKFKGKMNAIISTTNKLKVVVEALTNTLPTIETLILFSEYLHTSENILHALLSTNDILISDIVDAGLGRVNSKLLPIEHLHDALVIARTQHDLEPIFVHSQIEFYYPLIEATLTGKEILVHIPLKSKEHFTGWQLEPFPLKANNTLLILNKQPELIVVSDDFQLVDVTSMATLENCKSTFPHLHVCPAYAFAFEQAGDKLCELTLINSNSSKALGQCIYTPAPDKLVFHVHLQGMQYFYFKTITGVTLICQDKGKHIFADGYYMAPDFCEIRSRPLTTLPTQHHLAFVLNITTELIKIQPLLSVNISNLTIVSDKLNLLSYVNDTEFKDALDYSLPIYLSRPVLMSSFIVPIVLFSVCMCVLYCCLRRVFARYSFIVQKRNVKLARKALQKVKVTEETTV